MAYDPGHILVVDDDYLNRMTLAHGVEQQGHTVALAENGRQALEMLQVESFDLVLLDIIMPKMDGYQVLERMKDDSALRNIPVVVISAIDEMDSAAKCISMGAEDYLAKPFNPVLLEARIGACLEKKRLRDQERAYLKQLQIEHERLVLLNQVTQELTATLDIPQVIDRLLRAVTAIVGAEGASVWLRDKEEDCLVCQAAFYALQKHTPSNSHQISGKGIVGWVAETGNSVIVPHAPDDPRFSPDIDEQVGFPTASLLVVPLWVRQTVIGVLAVANKSSGDFGRDDCTLVETMAASAAIAFDNAGRLLSHRSSRPQEPTGGYPWSFCWPGGIVQQYRQRQTALIPAHHGADQSQDEQYH
jgi:CheY-like chemotaxis protein